MTEQQIPKLAAVLVEHQNAFAGLSTEDSQWVIQKTKEAIELFCKAVRERNVNVLRVCVFRVWKTIQLGTYKSVDELKTDLKKARRQISDGANDILQKITLSDVKKEIELVLVSVAELGFKDGGATLKEIFDCAIELGLELCPAEVGPQLALQYSDQSLGEWILIAMEPVARFGRRPLLVHVGRNDRRNDSGLWLSTDFGNPDSFWNPDNRFVFVYRK